MKKMFTKFSILFNFININFITFAFEDNSNINPISLDNNKKEIASNLTVPKLSFYGLFNLFD